jgi:hypothetical protein
MYRSAALFSRTLSRSRTMKRAAAAALALVLALAPRAAAQQPRGPTLVDSLAKVRVTQDFLDPRVLVGQLTQADTADLVVQRGDERLTIPLAYVRHVELATGRRTAGQGALRGAVYGFLGGATATGLLVLIVKASGTNCQNCLLGPSSSAALLGLPLTGVTTLTGAAVGASRPGDYWSRIPLPLGLREGDVDR